MPTLYDRRVLNDPEIRLAFNDPLSGIVTPEDCAIELDNTDRYFDALDLRGERLDLTRWDAFSNESQWELTGLVTDQETHIDRVILRVVAQDLADLQTLLPKRVVTAALFPLAHPTLGLGKPIPIIFGNAVSTHKVTDAWEMWYVGEDVGSNQYDLLVGEGTFTNLSAYRMTVGDTLFLIPPSEYTVNTSAYPGFTVLRFALKPTDFGGGYDRRFVAADSVENGRNGVNAVQALLNNSTWGLGLSVNTASFTAAAADWDAVGGLYVDLAITEQRPALDWLNDILILRGMRPERNSSGEWTLAVMKSQSTIKALLGHGPDQHYGGVLENGFGGLKKVSLSGAVKTLILDYRYNVFEQRYTLATTARSPFSFGIEKHHECRAIRDRTTADKVSNFLANRLRWEGDSLPVTADLQARQLRPGQLLRYQSTVPTISKVFLVSGLRRAILKGTTALECVGWDSGIFDYSALALPAEPANTTPTDYTRQTPTAASSLSIASSGVESDGQGGFSAYVVLQYTVPAETWAQTYIRFRRNGASKYETAAVDQETGTALQTKITGLITGAAYDYAISRINVVNPSLAAADLTLTNRTAPADTTAPGAPTGLAIVDQHLKTIAVKWTAPSTDIQRYEWEVRTAASGGGSLVDSGSTEGGGTRCTLTLDQIIYGAARFFRVRGVDWSGNTGSYSSSLSFSFSTAGSVDLTPEAATSLSRVSATTEISTSSTTPAFIQNDSGGDLAITKTMSGSPAEIVFSGDLRVTNDEAFAAYVHVKFVIYEDSTALDTVDARFPVIPASYEVRLPISYLEPRTPSAGSHTYKVKWYIGNAAVANTAYLKDRRLRVVDFIR